MVSSMASFDISHRYWIVQDIVLAQDIFLVCDFLRADWMSFEMTINALITEAADGAARIMGETNLSTRLRTFSPMQGWMSQRDYTHERFRALDNIATLKEMRYSPGKVSLKSLLPIIYGRTLTDLRDGEYLILGMAKDVVAASWKVD